MKEKKQGKKIERKKRVVICQIVVGGLVENLNCENLDSVYNGYLNINNNNNNTLSSL